MSDQTGVYKAILTANPQLFFEGGEPDDLTVYDDIRTIADMLCVLNMVDGGYCALIFKQRQEGE